MAATRLNMSRALSRQFPRSARSLSQPAYLSSLWRYHSTRSCPNTFKRPQTQFESLFHYDSGRWLWNEETQLRKRYSPFNVTELEKVVAQACGVTSYKLLGKGDEGDYNKAMACRLPDGSLVVARIPTPHAGPPFLTTASEVATIDFVRTVLDVPVPKVLVWSATKDISVESEYIVMEKVKGEQLGVVWDDMKIDEKCRIVEDLVDVQAKLLSVQLNRFGSLYYRDHAPYNAVPVKLQDIDLDEKMKTWVEKTFCIGPGVRSDVHYPETGEAYADHGPYNTTSELLKAIACREIQWLSKYANPDTPPTRFLHPGVESFDCDNNPGDHIGLYRQFHSVVPHLFRPHQGFDRPLLWHHDLSFSNIFVEDGRISGILDWQHVGIIPLSPLTTLPSIVDCRNDVALGIPKGYHDMEDEEKPKIHVEARLPKFLRKAAGEEVEAKRELDHRCQQAMVLFRYLEATWIRNRELAQWLDSNEHGLLRDLMIVIQQPSWNSQDLRPLRHCLIRLQQRWPELAGERVPCPLSFSAAEIEESQGAGLEYNQVADLWDTLPLSKTGFCGHEQYDVLLKFFREQREEGMKSDNEEEREVFTRDMAWVLQSKLTTEE